MTKDLACWWPVVAVHCWPEEEETIRQFLASGSNLVCTIIMQDFPVSGKMSARSIFRAICFLWKRFLAEDDFL